MSRIQETDAEVLANKPIELFQVKGKSYTTPIRSWDDSIEWLERAAELDALEADVRANKPSARREYAEKLFDAVVSYNPDALPADELRAAGITAPQLADAFARLRALSDPFDQVQVRSLDTVRKQLSGLPMNLIEKVFDNPAILSRSLDTSS